MTRPAHRSSVRLSSLRAVARVLAVTTATLVTPVSLVTLVTLVAAPALADDHEKPGFSVHDMLAMQRISDARVSPDGTRVLFNLRTTDLEANRGRTDLWMARVDGSGLRQLTTDPAADWNGRWAPDGKSIYFLSSRSGSSQVWQLPLNGGEARPITDVSLGVGNLVVAPNGELLAVSVETFPGLSIEETKTKLDERADSKTTGMLYDSLFVRHWDTWKDGRRSRPFVVNVARGEFPKKDDALLDGFKDILDADVPSKPFGGPEEMAFHPDSMGLVFAARIEEGSDEVRSTNFDLYSVRFDVETKLRNLTDDNEAWDTHPVFSPDGIHLAWLAMEEPGYESDRMRIRLMNWRAQKVRTLVPDWDRSPRDFAFSEDGRKIYAYADDVGQRSLFEIDVASGKVVKRIGQGTVRSIGLYRTAGGEPRMLFGMDHLRSPVELYTAKRDGTDVRKITAINDEALASARMGEPEQFSFPGWNDETVYAYVVRPADFDAAAAARGEKYPVAFLVHGGPQGSFGNDFHYRWNPQAYAGAGYAAVMVDFHGSTGYGQAFTDSIRGDWGGKPLVDLKKGLAAALERYPWMDGDRVCALGASFGGYMINWIAGQWPDRFDCLVNHDGNLDERAAYFMTEELWFPERDHEGTPWTNPEGYEKHNPVLHVDKWKTPMLVIHGALDYRVVDTQGIATFTALQRRGIPSRFLYFPDENHWVLQPANSIQWHETVLDWLDRWTAEDGGAAAAD